MLVYRAADCYLGGNDAGYGFVAPASGAVACSKTADNEPADRVEQWIPLTPGSHYFQSHYSTVWRQIGQQLPFDDTCICTTYTDNGAGLSWNTSVPATGSVTLSHLTNFGVGARNSTLTARSAIVHVTGPSDVSALQLSARLTDTESGEPVVGAPIEFRANDGVVCSAVTGMNGTASCIDPSALLTTAQAGGYTAVFYGDDLHLATTASAGLVQILGQIGL